MNPVYIPPHFKLTTEALVETNRKEEMVFVEAASDDEMDSQDLLPKR